MECLHCKNEFTPKRSTAQFCSDQCRSKYNFANKNTTQHQMPANVNNTPVRTQVHGFGLSGVPAFDYMFQRTEAENTQLKSENSRLKEKYDSLNDKYRDLKLDLATKDKLTDAEKAVEASKGLGGFLDKVTGNDRLMDAIERIALHKLGVGEEKETDLLDGVDENRMLLETILTLVRDQDQEFLAHFLKMTQFYIKNPAILVASSNGISKKINKETA